MKGRQSWKCCKVLQWKIHMTEGSIECINYDDFFCFFSAKTQQYDDFRVGEQNKYSGICEKLLHLSVK